MEVTQGDIRDDKHESPSDFSLTGKEDQWIERNNKKIRIDSSEVASRAPPGRSGILLAAGGGCEKATRAHPN